MGDRERWEEFIRSLDLPHFSPAEVLMMGKAHETPGHPGYRLNTLPPWDMRFAIAAQARMVSALRSYFAAPLTVLSWYRSPAYNRAIKGSPNSYHLSGIATDLTGAELDVLCLVAKKMQKAGLIGGLGIYGNRGFIHIDAGPSRVWGDS